MDSPLNSTNATNSTSTQESGFWPHSSVSIAWIFLIPIALIGNIFVIRTVFKVPKMKSPMNILFVNMAVCDIMTALTLIPFTFAQLYQSSQIWFSGTFGVVSCKAILYLSNLTIAGSISALTLMAFDRFFAISCPIRKVTFFKRYKTVSVIVWVPSIIIVLPVAFFANAIFDPIEGNTKCYIDWYIPFWRKFFFSYVFVVLYVVPLFILAVLYGIIAKELWLTKIDKELVGIASEDEKIQKRTRKKRKIVKMLMVILVVFAVCWLPVQVWQLLVATGQPVTQNIYFVYFAIWLCQANSALNPVLYITLHSGFRSAFMDCLHKCGLPVKRRGHNEEMQTIATKNKTALTRHERSLNNQLTSRRGVNDN